MYMRFEHSSSKKSQFLNSKLRESAIANVSFTHFSFFFLCLLSTTPPSRRLYSQTIFAFYISPSSFPLCVHGKFHGQLLSRRRTFLRFCKLNFFNDVAIKFIFDNHMTDSSMKSFYTERLSHACLCCKRRRKFLGNFVISQKESSQKNVVRHH